MAHTGFRTQQVIATGKYIHTSSYLYCKSNHSSHIKTHTRTVRASAAISNRMRHRAVALGFQQFSTISPVPYDFLLLLPQMILTILLPAASPINILPAVQHTLGDADHWWKIQVTCTSSGLTNCTIGNVSNAVMLETVGPACGGKGIRIATVPVGYRVLCPD